MEIIRTVADMKARAAAWKAEGLSIGLVPTMGSLHEGHESLMDAAREASDRVVVSVFVNPIQFGPGEDYEAYPRDLERDARICERHGVDVVFHPEVDDMYAPAHKTFVVMETLTDSLCGASRPGHFRGVCTVVTKLFNIVQPHRAFFGQKDAQQLAIIKRMVADLNMNVTVVGCPIVREADGLAKSSRNAYLSAEERQARLASVAQLDARKLELAAKQEMLSKAYDLALEKLLNLPDKEYVDLLADLAVKASSTKKEAVIFSQKDRTRYGKTVVTQANEKLGGGHLTLSEQTRPIKGGLILQDSQVETNCSFEVLIHLQRNTLSAEVAQVLFKE